LDKTNADELIDLNGNWEQKGNQIILKDYPNEVSIHNVWKIDKNGKCLKSRKGLNFRRLCYLESSQSK
jgi:hypothetical protein